MEKDIFEESRKTVIHRNKIYAAELGRLSGDQGITQEELDQRIETLFDVQIAYKKELGRRCAAVKLADAINAIEGVPVSDYARELSMRWANGEITGEQMKQLLLESHREIAERLK